MGNLNEGLVYTDESCTGCNRCISACPVMHANHAVSENDQNRVCVDGDACVHCGACMDVCHHNARKYRDDTDRFFEDLKKGEKISLLLAPAFIANYPAKYSQILGYLKSLGVNHIVSISFGADITTWGYLNYITKYNFTGGISQPCPAIVDYIEQYVPELIPRLVPVHSPMMCGAVYVKKYMHVSDKLAFISPCIAKKSEIMRPQNNGYVSYNVTFQHLVEKLKGLDLSGYSATDEIEYGLGSVYPQPGGLKENVEYFLGKEVMIRQIEGEKHAYDFLHAYAERVRSGKPLPFMVDALNCGGGCIFGTATNPENAHNDDVLFEIQKQRTARHEGKKDPWDKSADYDARLRKFNEQFKDLRLEDFMCVYTNRDNRLKEVTQSQLEAVFSSMGKNTERQRTVNCSACGYDTCRGMAIAIANGLNRKENCIHYVKDQMLIEKEEIRQMTEEMQEKSEKREAEYQQIMMDFKTIRELMNELASGNQESAADATAVAQIISEVLQFSDTLKKSIDNVSDSVRGYDAINEAIIKISNQTSMLALNAGIEAARSGEAGRGFAVIAGRVRELSERTKTAMEDGKRQSDTIIPAMEELHGETTGLLHNVEDVNDRVTSMAAVSEEIAAKAAEVERLVTKIVEQMEAIVRE